MNREKDIEEIKGWFKNHKAEIKKLDENTTVISWSQPKTSQYWMKFILDGGFICVMGDCGEAIYQLTEKADIERFAKGYALDYFTGKLACSRHDKKTFNSQTAKERLIEWKQQLNAEELLTSDAEVTINELISGIDECSSKSHWEYTLTRNEDQICEFECDWWEWLPGIGDELDITIIAYWVGLKMAAQQFGYETKYFNL
jgi:hypothetical protein